MTSKESDFLIKTEVWRIVRLFFVLKLTIPNVPLKVLLKNKSVGSIRQYSPLESKIEAFGKTTAIIPSIIFDNFGERWAREYPKDLLCKANSILVTISGTNYKKEINYFLGEITQEQIDKIPENKKLCLTMLTRENIEGLRIGQNKLWPEDKKFLEDYVFAPTEIIVS
ncbi:MAG: hypothetical protein ABH967_02300 [Patescibacteria group bacterium]